MNKQTNNLVELLAEVEHNQWCYWVRALLLQEELPDDLIKKWTKNLVPYKQLPEELKELDRIWAREVIKNLQSFLVKQEDLPKEYADIINKHFWDLI